MTGDAACMSETASQLSGWPGGGRRQCVAAAAVVTVAPSTALALTAAAECVGGPGRTREAVASGRLSHFFARKPLRLSLLYLSYYLHCMYLYELRHAHLRRARACPVVWRSYTASARLSRPQCWSWSPPRSACRVHAGRPCCRCTCALLNCEHRGSL